MPKFSQIKAQLTTVYDDATCRWLAKQPPVSAEILAEIRSRKLTMENPREKWQAVAKLVDFQPGEHHLDVGCGAGLLALPTLQQAKTRYTGLDLSGMTLAITAQHAHNQTANFSQAEAIHLPFRNRAYSVITAIGFSEYWPADYLIQFLREAERILAANGRIIIDFMDRTKSGAVHSRTFEALRGLTIYTPTYTDIDLILEAAGLQATRTLNYERRIINRVQRSF